MRARLAVLVLLAACSSTGSMVEPVSETPADLPAVTDDEAYVETFEVRFGGDHVGYATEVLPVPEGWRDARRFPAGTWIVQDLDFGWIGFRSPRGASYKFDAAGEAKRAGFGSRTETLAMFFKRPGTPELLPLVPR